VHDPPLDGGHRLKLDDLASLGHAVGGSIGHIAELVLAAATVVLDVHRDPVVLTLTPCHDQVHQVLQARQLLAAAPDENAQVVSPHVELRGLGAHGDLDRAAQIHEAQQFLEDVLRLVQDRTLLLG
jgi:hypothetical protein